jgi:hypothetical protein
MARLAWWQSHFSARSKDRPFVGKIYPLSEVAKAWQDSRSNHVDGKIVFEAGERRSASLGA